jgi:diguanylate cyclase (GGDEF)-like protein/PAS domain S-box-containing protein
MTLRVRTLLIIGATILGLVVVVYLLSRTLLLASVSKLEEQVVRQNVDRAVSGLSVELAQLDNIAKDWAIRDETYNFIVDRNPEYMTTTLVPSALAAIQVDLMLFADYSGEIVVTEAADRMTGMDVPFPESLLREVAANHLLIHLPELGSRITGIVLLSESPLLVASRPVLGSSGEGPVRGTVLVGRYLDTAEVEKLAEMVHLTLAVRPLAESRAPPGFEGAHSASGGPPILVRPANEKSTRGYALLSDIYGKPALTLEIEMPREIYAQGRATVVYVVIWLVVVSLVFGGVFLLLLERQVLSRLAHLGAAVREVAASRDLKRRVSVSGRDEIVVLASEINGMLGRLEESQEKLRASEEEYRSLFEQSRDAIYITTREGRFIDINQAALELLGYTKEEILDANARDLYVDPSDREVFQREVEKAGFVIEHPLKLHRKDGREIDCLLTVTVRRGQDGSVLGYRGLVRDITERKRAEELTRKQRQIFESILEQSLSGYWEWGIQDNTEYLSPGYKKMLGYEDHELANRPETWQAVILPEDVPRVLDLTRKHIESHGKVPYRLELRFRHKNGSTVWVICAGQVVDWDAQGRAVRMVGCHVDITARKRAEEALRESEERFRSLYENTTVGIYRTTPDGRILMANPAAMQMLGCASFDELAQRNLEEIGFEPSYPRSEFRERLEKEGVIVGLESAWVRKDGLTIFVRESTGAVRDESGKVLYYDGTFEDITEQKKAEAKLTHLATHDALTDLSNRVAFDERLLLELAHAGRDEKRLAVMLLDLDRFKDVNDTFGHTVGDRLLQAVGERLKASLRSSDTVARLGGDEFLVLLPKIARPEDALGTAEKILDAVRRPLAVDGQELRVTTSIGVALYPDDGEESETLVKNADIAMYRAKEKGRNNYERYTPKAEG